MTLLGFVIIIYMPTAHISVPFKNMITRCLIFWEYLDMSDTLNSTQIVISSDSLDTSIETISGDSETIPVNNSDSGNSSRTDESLNNSACAGYLPYDNCMSNVTTVLKGEFNDVTCN